MPMGAKVEVRKKKKQVCYHTLENQQEGTAKEERNEQDTNDIDLSNHTNLEGG